MSAPSIRRHEAQYAHSNAGECPEIVTLRASAIGALRRPQEVRLERGDRAREKGRRRAFLDGRWIDTAVYARAALKPGVQIDGPALIEEAYATTVLPEDWLLQCADTGELIAEAQ